jgi:HD-GYP domain-containing protein (c-di-GMP phosphodiesterase class II)
MKRSRVSDSDERHASLPQRLARRSSTAFFLASIVPLAFFAIIVHYYVLPNLVPGEQASVTTAMLLLAVLVLLSFIVQIEVNRETIHRIQTANDRLKSLLDAATLLGNSTFTDLVAKAALETATNLVPADMAFIFLRPSSSEAGPIAPQMLGPTAQAFLDAQRQSLQDLVEHVMKEKRSLALSGHAGEPGAYLSQAADGPSAVVSILAEPLLAPERPLGAIVLVRNSPGRRFKQEEVDLVSILMRQTGVALENARLSESQKNFFTHVTEILVDALDRHARHQAGHSQRVAYYSNLLGHELSLAGEQLQRLFFAALLHDIGMLRLPLEDPSSEPRMHDHPALAAEMLRPITVWSDLAPFVLHHHERFDGLGYPQGLRGDAIPFEARIIAVADSLDAMTSARSYQTPRPLEAAAAEIEREVGRQFDPRIVSALRSLVERGELELAPS